MLLALLSLLQPASADVLRAYDMSRFTGTCSWITVQAPARAERIVVGTAFTDVTGFRYAAQIVQDGVQVFEACFPDQVGRNGAEPTHLTVYFEDYSGGLETTIDWTKNNMVYYTTLGLVTVSFGQPRPIVPAEK